MRIVGANGHTVEGTLVDSTAQGASLVLPYEEPPPIAVGMEAELQFEVPGRGDAVCVDSVVRHVGIGDTYLRYGFHFDSAEIEEQLRNEDWIVFNRRRSPRVAFGTESPVTVQIETESGEELASGELHDLSFHGLCLRVPEAAADAVRKAGSMRARLTLPERNTEIEPIVIVHDERPLDGWVLFGCEIDALASANPSVLGQVIEDYVALGMLAS